MTTWVRAGLSGEALMRLPLTPEEGFVLSRIDAPLQTAEVATLTGLPPERVDAILARLVELGAAQSDALPKTADAEVEGAPAGAEGEAAPADPEGEAGPASEAEDGAASEPELPQLNEVGHRNAYETRLRARPLDERLAAARSSSDDTLMALSFDPDPQVLYAAIENSAFGLVQARFASRWHPTSAGLEALSHKSAWFTDPQLQRLLLRNVHVSELLTKRLLGGKRMLDAYKVSVDTDVPERTRLFARSVLRSKFGTAQGEERAGLISSTDGRVLAALAGLTLDGRCTSILCARSYTSALFVQSLARFGSCPPPLLAHLLKQPIVKRQQHLRNMIWQHPNLPAEAKRNK